jgi:hypothetical protein
VIARRAGAETQPLNQSEALVRNASNGRSKKAQKKGKADGNAQEPAPKEPEAKPKAPEPAPPMPIQKNRSKYMLSLGLVPKGQESILQYVKRPSDQKEPGAQAPTEKNLEQKLLELNRPSQHQAGRGQIDAEKIQEESKDQDAKAFPDPRFDDAFGQGDALGLPRPAEEKGSERDQPRRNHQNVFKSFAMGDDFDEDDDDDFRSRKRSEIIVS